MEIYYFPYEEHLNYYYALISFILNLLFYFIYISLEIHLRW